MRLRQENSEPEYARAVWQDLVPKQKIFQKDWTELGAKALNSTYPQHRERQRQRVKWELLQ